VKELDDGKLIFEIVETDKNTEVVARVQYSELKQKGEFIASEKTP
jgi:pyruvate kinase